MGVTQSYVGGTKRRFLVFLICMDWRPKKRMQGLVRAWVALQRLHCTLRMTRGNLSQCCFYGAGIGPVPCEAAAVAAGTLQLADLDGIHGIIIKFL